MFISGKSCPAVTDYAPLMHISTMKCAVLGLPTNPLSAAGLFTLLCVCVCARVWVDSGGGGSHSETTSADRFYCTGRCLL